MPRSAAAFSPPFESKIDLVCHHRLRATSSQIQVPGKTNDGEEIFERILEQFELFTQLVVLSVSLTVFS